MKRASTPGATGPSSVPDAGAGRPSAAGDAGRALPLLAPRPPDGPIARLAGEPVSATRFLAEARALAATLPEGGDVINLCADRYRFALGFAAALMRGSASLFPPNARPQTLALLAEPGRRRTVLVDEEGLDTGGLPQRRVEVDADAEADAVRTQAGTAVPCIDGDLDAAVLLTSGSTGTPQPHGKRWRMLVRNIAAEAQRLAEELGRPDLRGLTLVATVPPQHSYGFESSVLLALLGGAVFDGGRPFYPADIVAALDRVPRPRALVTTPFHLKTLLASGLALPPVDLLLSATAPLSPQLAAEAERATGGRLVEIYGCTEAGQVASRRTTAGDVWHTLGDLRVWRESAVADAEADDADAEDADAAARDGNAAADAQDARPTRLPRADDAGETAERYLVEGGHVEVPTPLADLLQLVDDRHFRLLGRANDLIHVGGKRSSLAHLNFHLNRVPGVVDGCFWLPDEDGEVVSRTVAFVVAPTLTAARVVEALRAELEPVFLPRRVVFVDALPREATGKLTAQTLRDFARSRLAPAADAAARTDAGSGIDGAAGTRAIAARCHIAADHPAFDGHFPGAPVLPGVVLLSELLSALLDDPVTAGVVGDGALLEQAKFLAPVGPATWLRLSGQPSDASPARWQLEARREDDDTVVARAVLRGAVRDEVSGVAR